ncbi:hypothetical protein P152DRAFT_301790 [Eremomyces bilateralis CBS 781.70]|uniref:Uncharacterized protein n=1 Tax=Eremomyces bilateralis CBS 781.70 TaxID=1392243 RepID=A0A6G1G7X4_9PEZI|nr:uncharacterized protein P152DRAFT_301790 [Eremomyces bilateralis CBS 781.70]KAF1814021.1 hypothetical protein P152DRAFT_301790 [Eremomyces bilateralis CBS 781.70]
MSTNLVPLGPLTTLWTPPASCLSTTTQWGQLGQTGALFIGYHSDLGPDADCFPSHRAEPTGSPVTTALIAFSTVTGPTPTPIPSIVGFTTITPTPTGPFKADPLFSQTGYTSKVAYYSPGICPSGYTYAATYTGWEKYYIFRTPLPTSSVTQHFCCPSGYRPNLRITSSVKGGAFRDYTTTWPSLDYLLCSATPTSVANVWTMTPGWPTVKPTSYSLGNVEYDGLHAVRVWASGVIVGYQSTDTAVLDYLHQNNITLQT